MTLAEKKGGAMKKYGLLCILFCLIASLMVVGCGDDKDNDNPTGPSVDPEDYDFYFAVSSLNDPYRENEFLIVVDSYSGERVEGVAVMADDQEVIMSNMWNTWTGIVTLDDNPSHHFAVVIGGDSFVFDLETASMPDVNWPQLYNPMEAMELAWTLDPDQNSEYQWLFADAEDISGNDDEKEVELDVAARSYTVPANWFDASFTDYHFYLVENNVKVVDELIAFSTEMSVADYWSYKQSTDRVALIKRIAKQLNR